MRKLLRFLLVLAVIAAALLTLPYLRYRRTAGAVPAWVRLGGMEVSGQTAEQVAVALRRGFEEPVAAYYSDQRILLRPQTVGFAVDTEAMLAEAQQRDEIFSLVRYLTEKSLDRQPHAVDVPLRYTLDAAALDAWLAEVRRGPRSTAAAAAPIRADHEHRAGEARSGARHGGVAQPDARHAGRPERTHGEPGGGRDPALSIGIQALGDLLKARLDQFPGIASVYLHYLPTGEEIAINPDVAYAGTSTLKIPILEQVYRVLDTPPGVERRRSSARR